MVIDDQDLVGQKEHHVALVVGPFQLQVDRFELEGDVIAEGAVEAELVVAAGKQILQRPDDGKRRGLAGPLFFLEHPVGLFDGQVDTGPVGGKTRHVRMALKRFGNRRDQDPAAIIERPDLHRAVGGFHDQRRVDQGHVPAGVAARIFVG